MNKFIFPLLRWVSRVLAILFALFVSIFALDVFGQGYSILQTVVALLIHLIPTALLVAALLVAWRREWLGGLLFIGLGVLYLVVSWGNFDWFVYLLMTGIPCFIGALFLTSWVIRVKPHAGL
jgi:hypothetical protein